MDTLADLSSFPLQGGQILFKDAQVADHLTIVIHIVILGYTSKVLVDVFLQKYLISC